MVFGFAQGEPEPFRGGEFRFRYTAGRFRSALAKTEVMVSGARWAPVGLLTVAHANESIRAQPILNADPAFPAIDDAGVTGDVGRSDPTLGF